MVIPILRVFDVRKADEFYNGFLGFRTDWEHRFAPDLPLYRQISREGAVLHLSEHHGDASPGSAVRIACADVAAYHAGLLAKNYAYARPGLEETAWNTLEVTVVDPFANRLIFYSDK